MNDMEKIWGMFERGMQSVLEFWPIKLACSGASAIWCYLFGGTEAIFLVVLCFVCLDTLTKWASITKRYLIDNGADPAKINAFTLLCGFFIAWRPGYLESSQLRRCWGDKLFTYLVLIICAGLMQKLPNIMIYGLAINGCVSGGIYSFIALTELLSICENFEQMGNKSLAGFRKLLTNITNRITGTSFSVTMQSGQGPNNQQPPSMIGRNNNGGGQQ